MNIRSRRRPASRSRSRNSAFVLVLVLIVVALLALSTYTFSSLMVTENESTVVAGQQLQTRMAVETGAAQVRYLLELTPTERQSLGGLYNNANLYQAQLLVNQELPRRRVRFGVVAPAMDEQGRLGGYRFGLQDESERLNLNVLAAEASSNGALSTAANAQAATSGATTSGTSSSGANASTTGAATSGANTGSTTSPVPSSNAASMSSATNSGASSGTSTTSGNTGSASTLTVDASGDAILMKLPGMTIDVAQAILDWLDADDTPREYGAEIDYYSSLSPPYAPANGPLKSIEELLLVRGVTPDLLFGRDVNRNGMLDVQEQSLPLMVSNDDGTGSMDLGWAAYLTLYSQERNVASDGTTRINVNEADLQTLYDNLSAVLDQSWVTFIVAYRQSGPYNSGSSNSAAGGATATGTTTGGTTSGAAGEQPAGNQSLDLTQSGQTQITQLFDLIGAKTQARLANNGGTVVLTSPFENTPIAMMAYLPKLMDYCTVNTAKTIPGRVNVNRASRVVLLAIPGMTEQIADSIISQRNLANSEFQEDMQTEGWLLTHGILTLDEMKVLIPYVCAGGDVYRSQVVGYFDEGEIGARTEVVFDATKAMPTILSWKDLSHLGRGYARETLGVDLTGSTRQ